MKLRLFVAAPAALAPAACATNLVTGGREFNLMSEAQRIKPNRLGFTTVRSGDTWQGVSERTGGLIPAPELAVLSGCAVDSRPLAGQRIKIVIAGE
jgi:predicted Zn-dependent protease